jgi:hypothetical protein
MIDQMTYSGIDPMLLPYLQTQDRAEEELLMTQLINNHAAPIVSAILKRKFSVSLQPADGSHNNQEALDIFSDIYAQLLSTLHRLKEDQNPTPINNFKAFVAVTTYSFFNAYLRNKNPHRRRLKNRLRYLLSHHPIFSIWEIKDQGYLCGLANWKEKSLEIVNSLQLEKLYEELHPDTLGLQVERIEDIDLHQTLTTLFKKTKRPLLLEDLINLIFVLCKIKEPLLTSDPFKEGGEIFDDIQDHSVQIDVHLDQHLFLKRLWEEIIQLPVRQRNALLLNLRDDHGGAALTLLPLVNIASMESIAQVLEISEERLAELWYDLPLDDATIAARLNLTRQQVINLRKSARERLSRRMKVYV